MARKINDWSDFSFTQSDLNREILRQREMKREALQRRYEGISPDALDALAGTYSNSSLSAQDIEKQAYGNLTKALEEYQALTNNQVPANLPARISIVSPKATNKTIKITCSNCNNSIDFTIEPDMKEIVLTPCGTCIDKTINDIKDVLKQEALDEYLTKAKPNKEAVIKRFSMLEVDEEEGEKDENI